MAERTEDKVKQAARKIVAELRGTRQHGTWLQGSEQRQRDGIMGLILQLRTEALEHGAAKAIAIANADDEVPALVLRRCAGVGLEQAVAQERAEISHLSKGDRDKIMIDALKKREAEMAAQIEASEQQEVKS